MTFLFDFHRWRGVTFDRDLFDFELCVGFVTVIVNRYSVPDVMRQWWQTIRGMKR